MDTQNHDLVLSNGFPTGSDRPRSLPVDASSVVQATSRIRKTAQGYHKERQSVRGQGYSPSDRQATTIYALPENVLLEIFCFYKEDDDQPYPVWKWHVLVHICHKWRQLVFASPLRLGLRIFCSSRNRVGKNLGIWPALPIFIEFDLHSDLQDNASGEEHIVAALEHVNRVCDVNLCGTRWELEKITRAMQKPFPVLKILHISSKSGYASVLPAEFLGGSAPRLQVIYLGGIPFPALPTLLLSTSELATLALGGIPPAGYISPEAMVAGLAALPRLSRFAMTFQLANPRPDRIHPAPVTRTVLPALTRFIFQSDCGYLEDLVARIDAPQLNNIDIRYLNLHADFQVAQLAKFIDRLVSLKLPQLMYAQVDFHEDWATFDISRHANDASPNKPKAIITIFCRGIDWQVSYIAQVLNLVSATLPNVVHLKLEAQLTGNLQLEGTDEVEWLRLLHQFSTVQTLHVSHELAWRVALALEDIDWETVAEVLPSLDLIYLAGQPASSVEKFVAARRLCDRPVTVVETKMEFDEKLESFISK